MSKEHLAAPPAVQADPPLDIALIRKHLDNGDYYHREDWGGKGLDCTEPAIEALLAEIERLQRVAPPAEPPTDPLAMRAVRALECILEIGKRNMSNPKYDGYFEEARKSLAALRAGRPADKEES